MGMYQEDGQFDTEMELKEPALYKVVLLNDDYTPMDFVVMILMTLFNKDQASAEKIMMAVHQQGRGICGVYTFEVAETKVKLVEITAHNEKHPLRCIMEEA